MLTLEEKLKFIKKESEKHGITAYDYGKNSDISEMSAYNILSGSHKNPRNKTLNTMLEYIQTKIVGTQLKEETTAYGKELPLEDRIANKVVKKLKPYLEKIELQENALALLVLEIGELKEKINH